MTPADSAISDRIDRLLADADAQKYGDRQFVFDTAGQAIVLAQHAGDYRRFAQGLYHQAWAAFTLNRLESCLSTSLQALQIARDHRFTDIEVDLLVVIADAFVEGRLDSEAEQLFAYALELSADVPDPKHRGHVLHDWAYSKLWKLDFNAATTMFEQAAALLSPDLHGGIDFCVTLGYLARSYYGQGRADDALSTANIAMDMARRTGNPTIISYALFTLAALAQASGDTTLARRYLAEAGIYPNTDFLALDVALELVRAYCDIHDGRLREAADLLEALYGRTLDRQLHREAVRTLDLLKRCYEGLDDMQGVLNVYERLNAESVRRERRNADLRMQILGMVFAQDKAALQARIHLTGQKYDILHRISHEFRTPLTIIQSSADIMDGYGEKLPLARRRDHLKNIAGQVKSMTAMLENISILLQDLPAPTVETSTAFSLAQLGAAAIGRAQSDGYAANRVTLVMRPADVNVSAPFGTLVIITYHLLHNALRYSADDVSLELAVTSGALTIRVTDRGIGIPKQEQDAVFEPLVRGTNQTDPTGGGLGLPIVARLVAELGGTIDLESAVGSGTTVTVRVPVAV